MKKVKYYLLAAVMALGILPLPIQAASYTDVYDYDSYAGAVERLKALDIVAGYDDGSFQPSNILTRAEFAKIIVCALDKETTARSNSVTTKFYDVAQNAWSVPYINYVSQNNIVVGYADGTFQPDKPITYAEALTVLCRILQYTEKDVGYYWPNNYLDRAAALGLTEDMNYSSDSPINRASAAVLVDRILFYDVNGAQNQSLLESLGYTVLEDCFIIASKNEDSSLNADQIRTSDGVYQAENLDILSDVNKIGTLILNSAKKAKQFTPDILEFMSVVITKVNSDSSVEYLTQGGEKGTYKFENTFTTYVDYTKTTYSAAKNSIQVDTDVTFYGTDYGNWSFAVVDTEQSDIQPMLAGKNFTADEAVIGGIQINPVNLKIYRNGKSVTLDQIEKYDVIYYNTKTNTMDVYTKKVTGIYYDASPDKTNVTSITVAGKNYIIGTDEAKEKLDASTGSYALGDKVTLLLGKNDEIAFVVEMTDFDVFNYGVLLSTYTRIAESGEKEGSSEIMASVFMPDGNTYDYVTDKDYKGDLMELTYDNGVVRMKKAGSSKIYGEIDQVNRTLGGMSVLDDVKIIQRTSEDDSDTVTLETLNFDTLDVSEIPERKLIASISANGFGDVGLLYVKDLSGSYEYGVMRSRTDKEQMDSYSGTYKIYTNGTLNSYSSSIRFTTSAGTPIYYKITNGEVSELYNMVLAASAGSIDAIDNTRVKVGGKVYKMWDMAQIVDISDSSSYKTVTVDELAKLKINSVKLYSDKAVDKGGIVRAIIITTGK